MEQYTLFNTLKFTYPVNCNVGISLLSGGTDRRLLTIPGLATKSIFAFGCLTLFGFTYYALRSPLTSIYQWFRTFGNARDRLAIKLNAKKKNQKVYVVVYGARNHGSRAFCSYLAEYGYSLIIIDSDQTSLNSAEKHVLKDFPDVSIMKVKMEEFDEVEALRIIKQLNKLGEVIRGVVLTKNVMLDEQNSKKFEGLNFEEIHQIMHDNNEMMVGLLNVLIKPIKKAGNGFIINLRNEKYSTEEDAVYWDLLYHSTNKFSKHFIDALRKSEADSGKLGLDCGSFLTRVKFHKRRKVNL